MSKKIRQPAECMQYALAIATGRAAEISTAPAAACFDFFLLVVVIDVAVFVVDDDVL